MSSPDLFRPPESPVRWVDLGETSQFRYEMEHPVLRAAGLIVRVFNRHSIGQKDPVQVEPGIGTNTDSPEGRLLIRALTEVSDDPFVTIDSRIGLGNLVSAARTRLAVLSHLGLQKMRLVGTSAGGLVAISMSQEDRTGIIQDLDTYSLPLQSGETSEGQLERFARLIRSYLDGAAEPTDFLPDDVLEEKALYRRFYGKDSSANNRAVNAFRRFASSVKPGVANELSAQDMRPSKVADMLMRGWNIAAASDTRTVLRLPQGLRWRSVVGAHDDFTNYRDHLKAAERRNRVDPGSSAVEVLYGESHSFLRDHRRVAQKIAANLQLAS